MKKIAFVGLTNLDYVYYVDRMPEENAKCRTTQYERYIGGPAANAAITYALLGGDATLITAFGTSGESKQIAEELESLGVKCINLSPENTKPGVSAICISDNGNRTIISGQAEYFGVTETSIREQVTDAFLAQFDGALFDCNRTDIALPILQRIKSEIVLDAGSFKEHTETFLQRASVVISSEKFRDPSGRDVFSLPYENIVHRAMTRGERSIITDSGEVPVSQVNCVDSLAAGDILHGAFCFFYFEKGLDFTEALKEASRIASKSVRFKGPRAWCEFNRE